MNDLHLIAILLGLLISICTFYFKKWDAKVDKLTDLFNNHETRISLVENDLKQSKQNTKP